MGKKNILVKAELTSILCTDLLVISGSSFEGAKLLIMIGKNAYFDEISSDFTLSGQG